MNDQRKEEIEAAENYFIGGKRPGRIRISSQLISIDQDNKRGLETFCPRGKAQSAPKGNFTTDVGDSLTRFFPEKGKWKEEKRRGERESEESEREKGEGEMASCRPPPSTRVKASEEAAAAADPFAVLLAF